MELEVALNGFRPSGCFKTLKAGSYVFLLECRELLTLQLNH